MTIPESLTVRAVWAGLQKFGGFAFGWMARRRATNAALAGEDFTARNSLETVVKAALESLASRDTGLLPVGVQPAAFRNWLLDPRNLSLFAQATIAYSAGVETVASESDRELISNYEALTHGSKEPIAQQVKFVASYIHAEVGSTEKGREVLQLALSLWSSGQLIKATQTGARRTPSDAEFANLRAAAVEFIEAAKRVWKMPQFIAPLRLEARERSNSDQVRQIASREIASSVAGGSSYVLFGDGGIGKTTFLVDLASACLNAGQRIPLFVDAPTWAQSNSGLFSYIASRPSAQKHSVDVGGLTKLALAGQLAIFLNGWNEMSSAAKQACRDDLHQLMVSAPSLSVVITSRSVSDAPDLHNRRSVQVLGLTWLGQCAIIEAELPGKSATLVDFLTKDTRMRHSARSPLILRGLIGRARKGAVEEASNFELIGAAVEAFEEDSQRLNLLLTTPVEGHQRVYLEELAVSLTDNSVTRFSRDDALMAIRRAAELLVGKGMIGVVPSPAAILDVLVSHHLLHRADGEVRFAHQRFQEYFAASRVIRACLSQGRESEFLRRILNHEAWADALFLCVTNLLASPSSTAALVSLIETASSLDLALACELAGVCGFTEEDNPHFYRKLVEAVNELTTSSIGSVRALSTACQILSRFPAFVDSLWALLENDNQQFRLRNHRLSGSRITLNQLGIGAIERIASWPEERRAEFVHEIATNSENYEFVVGLAFNDPSAKVRSAAITTLSWYYPASEKPMEAWLKAPYEVQTEQQVLSSVYRNLEDGNASAEVRARLNSFDKEPIASEAQIELALTTSGAMSSRGLDAILSRLKRVSENPGDARLVDFVRSREPEKLLQLAQELALQKRPEWVGEVLRTAPAQARSDLFDRAWSQLMGADFKAVSGAVFGPLANRAQVDRCLQQRLENSRNASTEHSDLDRDRARRVEELLEHASGEDLIVAVLERAHEASYRDAIELLESVLRRIGLDEISRPRQCPWLPSVEQVGRLVQQFAEKVEEAPLKQERVRILLSRIASHVAPEKFGSTMLETSKRFLDGWSAYRAAASAWDARRSRDRPSNPMYGQYLAGALARWGPAALPGLTELMSHASWADFLPEAIVRVSTVPWSAMRDRVFDSVSGDIREGERRRTLGRALKQPDDAFQRMTDEAAAALVQKLEAAIEERSSTASLDSRTQRQLEYRIGALASAVARVPSEVVLSPVLRAVESGHMDFSHTVSTMRSLVRQGYQVSDSRHVRHFEQVFEKEAAATWHDQWKRHVLGEACLLLCVTPAALRAKSLKHYIEQWKRFDHPNEMVRECGATQSDSAWEPLMEASRLAEEGGGSSEEFVHAVTALLTPARLSDFCALIVDRTLLRRARSSWTLERVSERIADCIKQMPSSLALFVDSCRAANSSLADALAGEVLSHIEGAEDLSSAYLLEALDSNRGSRRNEPAFDHLLAMFDEHVPISDSQFQIVQRSNNALRRELYVRATASTTVSAACRRLLASLELSRMEKGRPTDEVRHPQIVDGLPWTDIFKKDCEAAKTG